MEPTAETDLIEGAIAYRAMSVKSIKGADEEKDPGRFFSGMLNAASVDREYEQFEPLGCDLSGFKAAGGPILVSHFSEVLANGESAVVARCHSVRRSEKGIFIDKAEFDTDPISEHYKGKVQRGFIRCLSAGFAVRKVEYKKARQDAPTIRVVTKSELIHGILTSQPVNRESLIAAKSMNRIAELEAKIESMAGDTERVERIFGELQEIAEQVRHLSVRLDGGSKTEPVQPELDRVSAMVAGTVEAAFKAAHPRLPESAYVVESGWAKTGHGRPTAAHLHLPHHDPNVKDGDDHGTVNKALLRNAFARLDQVEPVTEDAEAFRQRALRHLRAHADALGMSLEA